MFEILDCFSSSSRPVSELPSEIPSLNSTRSLITPASRHSLQSIPEDSNLMPPPDCQSSMIQNKNERQRKRKCESDVDLEADQVPQSSSSNSTDIISTSIRNSRETIFLSQENVVKGKRSRRQRK